MHKFILQINHNYTGCLKALTRALNLCDSRTHQTEEKSFLPSFFTMYNFEILSENKLVNP